MHFTRRLAVTTTTLAIVFASFAIPKTAKAGIILSDQGVQQRIASTSGPEASSRYFVLPVSDRLQLSPSLFMNYNLNIISDKGSFNWFGHMGGGDFVGAGLDFYLTTQSVFNSTITLEDYFIGHYNLSTILNSVDALGVGHTIFNDRATSHIIILSPGLYNISFATQGTTGFGLPQDYDFNLTITNAVPEPATIVMAATGGFAMLSMMACKRTWQTGVKTEGTQMGHC